MKRERTLYVSRFQFNFIAVVSTLLLASCTLENTDQRANVATAETAEQLFAVEIRTDPEWDPSMTARTFTYEVHVLNVFYPGLVQP
ncbi:hypothetical protein [Elongatibacter sediminis]|uniref:Spondin domain-containing protein n=1 Tax=Elongatibacter sediminis TaxID=3119006 RepID=A0AAW9RM78_9GAMM